MLVYTKYAKRIKINGERKKLVLCTVVEIGVPPGGGQGGRGGQSFHMGNRGRYMFHMSHRKFHNSISHSMIIYD